MRTAAGGAAQPGVRTGHGLPPVGGHGACRLGARLPPGSRAPVSGRARRPGDGLPEPARSRCSRVPHRVVRRVGGGDAGAVGAARDAEPGHAPAGVVAVSPITDLTLSSPSIDSPAGEDMLARPARRDNTTAEYLDGAAPDLGPAVTLARGPGGPAAPADRRWR